MDFASKLIELLTGQEISDESMEKEWIQVGKLSPEDFGKGRSSEAAIAELQREASLLLKKLGALRAQIEVHGEEWWNHIYKTYSLPRGCYQIHTDGRIFKQPKKDK